MSKFHSKVFLDIAPDGTWLITNTSSEDVFITREGEPSGHTDADALCLPGSMGIVMHLPAGLENWHGLYARKLDDGTTRIEWGPWQ